MRISDAAPKISFGLHELTLEPLSGCNARDWEEFNARSPAGSLFHTLSWKTVLEDGLNVATRYYLVRDGSRVAGICPFVEYPAGYVNGVACLPHSEYNHLIMDPSFDPSRFTAVLDMLSREFSFVQLTTYNPALLDRTKYSTFPAGEMGNMILSLRERPPEIIWGSLSKKTRKSITRFEKEGYYIDDIQRASDIDTFYAYYAANVAHIRGEALSLSFIRRMWDVFPRDRLRIVILTNGEICAGGTLAIMDPLRKIAFYHLLALNRSLPHYTPTYSLDWDLIEWAYDHGYERLSFGRQKLDPLNPRYSKFKAKYGTEYMPMHTRLVIFSKAASLVYRLKHEIARTTGRFLRY